ncbi:MAG TPA: DUF1127 domain-containing protein [Gammaproteobacteria bacterium]|nr:DUF1127 domain-containing protein [Gammaproteobacteria bacterium]
MTSRYLQNPARIAKLAHNPSADNSFGLPAGLINAVEKTLGRIYRAVLEIDRKRELEYRNRRAIAHLESLTDEQLRDVGIQRPDIARAVRLGKDHV